MTTTLVQSFLESARAFPSRAALEVNGNDVSYRELALLAGSIAAAVTENTDSSPLGAVLAHQSLSAYAGILGVLMAGRGYVPIHPHHPTDRTLRVLEISGCRTIVAGVESLASLRGLLGATESSLRVILPFVDANAELVAEFPQHRLVFCQQLPVPDTIPSAPASKAEDIAYVIFTSGSTGVPKGVPVTHSNVAAYVSYVAQRFSPNETDRYIQLSDITFDLSIHPIWSAWSCGACVCAVPDADRMAPAKFVRERAITIWTSVPSAVLLLEKMHLLKPGSFPTIRYSMFCGEPLTARSAMLWQAACPQSRIDNFYGPTEATVAITHFSWEEDTSAGRCVNGIVPLGWPFTTQKVVVVDENLRPVGPQQIGELCLSGSQVTSGYFGDPTKTSEKYVSIIELGDDTWYRTGDVVRQDADGCLHFYGRLDFQAKVLGHRIELQDVENALRIAAGTDAVVCVAWPVVDGTAQGIVGFVEQTTLAAATEGHLLEACRETLPAYMVPKRIVFLQGIPLSQNGKFDRNRLVAMLDRRDWF